MDMCRQDAVECAILNLQVGVGNRQRTKSSEHVYAVARGSR